jgi:hypothetical protein
LGQQPLTLHLLVLEGQYFPAVQSGLLGQQPLTLHLLDLVGQLHPYFLVILLLLVNQLHLLLPEHKPQEKTPKISKQFHSIATTIHQIHIPVQQRVM